MMYFVTYKAAGSPLDVDLTVGLRSEKQAIAHALAVCRAKGYVLAQVWKKADSKGSPEIWCSSWRRDGTMIARRRHESKTTTGKIIASTESPSVLAQICQRDWERPYFGAVPYLQAMRTMDTFQEDYGCDSGRSVGLYFLANAQAWRGPVARLVKARIKALCGVRR